jgi:hypothetical protein
MVGLVEGTDKSSILNDYLRSYEKYLSYLRHSKINVLEVGVAGGKSLKTWKQFFTSATIVGMDILESCRQLEEERVVIRIGSQDDPQFLSDVCAEYPPTVFIDDGSHVASHVLFTFNHVFPLLQPGGVYVIEDLNTCSRRDEAPITPHELIARMAQSIMERRGEWYAQVENVTVIPGAAFISKCDPAGRARLLDQTEELVRRTGTAREWATLATRLSQHHSSFARAELAMRHAIELDPRPSTYHWRRGFILGRLGKLSDALDSLDIAIERGEQEKSPRLQVYRDLRAHLANLLARHAAVPAEESSPEPRPADVRFEV